MQTGVIRKQPVGPTWFKKAIGAALFLGVAIAMHGVLLSVEYHWSTVLEVQIMAGRDASHRMVLVETPERLRVIQTSDSLIHIEKGAQVCVSRRRMISKHWRRYTVALPGYCRNQPRPRPSQRVMILD